MKLKYGVEKIISGFQAGSDLAGVDFAIEVGVPYSGFVPKGRRTETGPLDEKYCCCIETTTSAYPERTEMNVRTGNATIIFATEMGRGSKLTSELCIKHKKPWIQLNSFPNVDQDAEHLAQFLSKTSPRLLNVAGSAESKCPGIHDHVVKVLKYALLHV
jgi:hypothetical protein